MSEARRPMTGARIRDAIARSRKHLTPADRAGFATAALDAAKQWDFAPAKIDGHVVPSEWLLHFDFTPAGTKVTPLATNS